MMGEGATIARGWVSFGIALVAAAASPGCADRQTVVSQLIAESPTNSEGEPGGLIYSLPKSIVTVRGELGANGAVTYNFTNSIVPDSTSRFRLRYVASGWTDDDLNLQVDRNGLLTSGRANVTDRSAEVLVQLARSAGAIAGAAAVPFGAQTRRPQQPTARYPFTSVLEVDDLVTGTTLPDGSRISLRGIPSDDQAALSGPQDGSRTRCNFSVCYRTVMHVTARISGTNGPGTEVGMVLVNPYRTEGVDLRGTPLVARTNTLTFDSGLLTGQAVAVPSTAVAVASVPYNVLRGFFSAFGELLTLRVNNTNSQAALIAAQTSVINNTRTQLEAERALQAARSQGQQAAPAVAGLGSSP